VQCLRRPSRTRIPRWTAADRPALLHQLGCAALRSGQAADLTRKAMKFLFDLFPVILFFAMFKWGEGNPEAALALSDRYLSALIAGGSTTLQQAPILLATAVAILATVAQILYLIARGRRIEPMLWISLGVIAV